jgi:ATP-dependent helicase HrpB
VYSFGDWALIQNLKGVDAVVLDEFHERHLESDLSLALLKRLQKARPQLCIVVMSATLEAGPVAKYLNECPVLRSEGRTFELSTEHLPYSPEPLQVQIAKAVELLVRDAQCQMERRDKGFDATGGASSCWTGS